MPRRIRITWDKIRIHKSEDYEGSFLGVDGEPGDEAEWELNMSVMHGKTFLGPQLRWSNNSVKDSTSHVVDMDLDVVHDGPFTVVFHGGERDTLGSDSLPERWDERSPSPTWEHGQKYKERAKADDYEYTVYYTIRYLDPPPVAVLTPGHGTIATPRYSGLWTQSQERMEWFLDLTADQLNQRASWLWGKGGRLRQLQPVMSHGEVRYNTLWDYSGIGQLWNVDCDENHFRKTTDENWHWARPASVVPFVRNGQLRYSVLWNAGQHGQVWHPNTDEAGFLDITGQTWSWARPHQVYAFVLGGQVRYSCLWNAGRHAQRWHHNCSGAQATAIGSEVWSWARAHQIQPFIIGNERRYSVLWNAGQQRQLWNIDCTEKTLRANTADTRSWARPTQIYEA